MFRIKKQFHFSASHQLDRLPAGHPCARLHGHNYIVEIELQSEQLNEYGFVLDYGDLKPFANYLDEHFDHRHLNDLLPIPSSEYIAQHLFQYAKQLWQSVVVVRVSETPRTWAEYTEV